MSVSILQRDLLTRACYSLGYIQPGEDLPDEIVTAAQDTLQELIDNWSTHDLTVVSVNRYVFDLVSGQGGPDDPYTIGPGGDWDTGTQPRPTDIVDAMLVLNTSSPAVEIPLAVVTVDQYAAQAIKTQTNPLAQWLYYNPGDPLGNIYLWNVPTNATNQIALYLPVLTAQFVDLDSTYYVCPPGYLKAFRLCLAEALIPILAIPPQTAQTVMMQAHEAFNDLKLSNTNTRMADLTLDPAYTPNPHGSYIIQTDTGA